MARKGNRSRKQGEIEEKRRKEAEKRDGTTIYIQRERKVGKREVARDGMVRERRKNSSRRHRVERKSGQRETRRREMRQNDFPLLGERQRLPIPLYPPAANPPPSKRVFKVTSWEGGRREGRRGRRRRRRREEQREGEVVRATRRREREKKRTKEKGEDREML